MVKRLFIVLFFASPCLAYESVTVINSTNNPVNVTGSVTTSFNNSAQPIVLSTTSVLINGSSNTVISIPNRSSQKTNRTQVQASLNNLTANATAYSVTGGKILYMTSLTISAFNTSSTSSGLLVIQDGANIISPFTISQAGVGALLASEPLQSTPINYYEPKQFSTSINVRIGSGTITYSMDFIGYEE